jgi:hypothetical protein
MSRSVATLAFTACLLALLPLTLHAADAKRDNRIGLFDTYESLAAHYDNLGGSVLYDPKTKSLSLHDSSSGVIFYNANWEQLEFDVTWDKLVYQKPKVIFTFGIGADKSKLESIDVSNAFPRPGKYAVKITYKEPTLSVFVNGRLARKPLTVTNLDTLKTLKLDFDASFSNARLSNPLVTGATPEETPHADVGPPKPPANPQVIPLFQTKEDFEKHWPYPKSADYNPRSKSVTVAEEKGFATWRGSFTYGARWQELELSIVASPSKLMGPKPPAFRIDLGRPGYIEETFTLDQSLAKIGLNQIKLVIDGHTLTAYLNGKPAWHQMTLLKDIHDLYFAIECMHPMEIGNVKVKADPER